MQCHVFCFFNACNIPYFRKGVCVLLRVALRTMNDKVTAGDQQIKSVTHVSLPYVLMYPPTYPVSNLVHYDDGSSNVDTPFLGRPV